MWLGRISRSIAPQVWNNSSDQSTLLPSSLNEKRYNGRPGGPVCSTLALPTQPSNHPPTFFARPSPCRLPHNHQCKQRRSRTKRLTQSTSYADECSVHTTHQFPSASLLALLVCGMSVLFDPRDAIDLESTTLSTWLWTCPRFGCGLFSLAQADGSLEC